MLPVKYPSIDTVKVNSSRSWKGTEPALAQRRTIIVGILKKRWMEVSYPSLFLMKVNPPFIIRVPPLIQRTKSLSRLLI